MVQESSQTQKSKRILIVIAIVLALAVVGIAVYYLNVIPVGEPTTRIEYEEVTPEPYEVSPDP